MVKIQIDIPPELDKEIALDKIRMELKDKTEVIIKKLKESYKV